MEAASYDIVWSIYLDENNVQKRHNKKLLGSGKKFISENFSVGKRPNKKITLLISISHLVL